MNENGHDELWQCRWDLDELLDIDTWDGELFHLTESFVEDIRKDLPALPLQLIQQFQESFGLTEYDANNLCADKSTADYFLEVSKYSTQYKAIANWMLGPIKQQLNETAKDLKDTYEFLLKNEKCFERINLCRFQIYDMTPILEELTDEERNRMFARQINHSYLNRNYLKYKKLIIC